MLGWTRGGVGAARVGKDGQYLRMPKFFVLGVKKCGRLLRIFFYGANAIAVDDGDDPLGRVSPRRMVAVNECGHPGMGRALNIIDGGGVAKAARVPLMEVYDRAQKEIDRHNPAVLSDEELVAEVEARGLAWEYGGRDFR